MTAEELIRELKAKYPPNAPVYTYETVLIILDPDDFNELGFITLEEPPR